MHVDSDTVTSLLAQWTDGDARALDALFPLVYDELRRLARSYLQRERSGQTLQSTALVHEAYLRLVNQNATWQNRAHFFGIAAQMMRRILIDHARARNAARRGDGVCKVTLDEDIAGGGQRDIDVIALDEALTRLAQLDAQQSRIVELRFFAGLSIEDTAEVMKISPATVKRDWAMAKAWLYREMSTWHEGRNTCSRNDGLKSSESFMLPWSSAPRSVRRFSPGSVPRILRCAPKWNPCWFLMRKPGMPWR